jgi:hypothetical protein
MGGDVPGQQISDAVDRMVCNTAENVAQVGLRIESVELGGFDQGYKDWRGSNAAGISGSGSTGRWTATATWSMSL